MCVDSCGLRLSFMKKRKRWSTGRDHRHGLIFIYLINYIEMRHHNRNLKQISQKIIRLNRTTGQEEIPRDFYDVLISNYTLFKELEKPEPQLGMLSTFG